MVASNRPLAASSSCFLNGRKEIITRRIRALRSHDFPSDQSVMRVSLLVYLSKLDNSYLSWGEGDRAVLTCLMGRCWLVRFGHPGKKKKKKKTGRPRAGFTI